MPFFAEWINLLGGYANTITTFTTDNWILELKAK